MFFEFIGIAHKKSPFTNCPVKGVHIRNDNPLSFLSGLTSKGQVGVLLWEHRGWILRIAKKIGTVLSRRFTFDSNTYPQLLLFNPVFDKRA